MGEIRSHRVTCLGRHTYWLCPYCQDWIKDKFIFGLLHFCLTKEEREAIDRGDK